MTNDNAFPTKLSTRGIFFVNYNSIPYERVLGVFGIFLISSIDGIYPPFTRTSISN